MPEIAKYFPSKFHCLAFTDALQYTVQLCVGEIIAYHFYIHSWASPSLSFVYINLLPTLIVGQGSEAYPP